MNTQVWIPLAAVLLVGLNVATAEVKVTAGQHPGDGAGFKFEQVPAPVRGDAATQATFTIVAGERDRNGGDLPFDISRTGDRDAFGNSFFSEVDVIEPGTPGVAITSEDAKPVTRRFEADGGKYRFTIDATLAPDLMDWADTELRPVVQEWYPKLIALLPSEGFKPRTNLTIRFREDMGGTPASAGGGFINCNAGWFRRELKREARGSVVHEMVHVVQNYSGRRTNANATRMPGWLVEGIPDYIRWFLYEPQSKGAEITQRNLARARYDASYRITGNFLNWVTEKYDTNIVRKLNAAGRAGNYSEEIWKAATGKTSQELGAEWKKAHEERLAQGAVKKPE